jgi:hypothetical protein
MADGNASGNNGMLYFIVGALCVVVAAGAFFMFGGHVSGPNQAKSVDVKVELPTIEKK